jgi:hypothetical protein
MTEEKKPRKIYKTLLIVIVTFLVTVIIVVGGLAYYIMAKNPLNIKGCLISGYINPLIKGTAISNIKDKIDSSIGATGGTQTDYDHPLLSPQQEAMLEDAGVDVSKLPSTIPPELESCLIGIFGKERVEEIKAGDIPGPLEIIRGKDCFQ